MLPAGKCRFELDERIEADSHNIMWLGLCELRLADDKRWPWVMLVPQRHGITEIHDLTPLDQTMLTFETNMVSEGAEKSDRMFQNKHRRARQHRATTACACGGAFRSRSELA